MLSLLFAAVSAPANCPVDRLQGASVEATQAAWLDRFNALDLPCFLRFFASDATIFSPLPIEARSRRVEPAQRETYWRQVFAGFDRPRLDIRPNDVRVTRLGRGSAIISFHLSSDAHPNRRTLVWRRERSGWRIVHLHGSRLTAE